MNSDHAFKRDIAKLGQRHNVGVQAVETATGHATTDRTSFTRFSVRTSAAKVPPALIADLQTLKTELAARPSKETLHGNTYDHTTKVEQLVLESGERITL